jgi:hypothetical protein
MSKAFPFTQTQWDDAFPHVTAEMHAFLQPFRAPVYEHRGDHGVGWGSGSYIRIKNRLFILTNKHVLDVKHQGRKLAYQFDGQPNVYLSAGQNIEVGWPEDLALLPVDDGVWNATAHTSKAIDPAQIASRHAPVEHEMLAFVGFAGDNVQFVWSTINAKSTTLITREVPVTRDPGVVDPKLHFGIDYRTEQAIRVSGSGDLPLPPGLSGSTVWNTRFVETAAAEGVWTPDLAQVTGVIWGWPSSQACLVATRAEQLRAFLAQADQYI